MEFMVGCNYWASNAGTDMWRFWDEKVVDEDLRRLKEAGVRTLRVFPNWRDFQPVIPRLGGKGSHIDYYMEGDIEPSNEFYIDETKLNRFKCFCRMCEKYGLKLIVGILTGWMSGRLYIPSVLFDKNLFTDSLALWFEERFIRGFVSALKDEPAIIGWNPGNECNMLSEVPSRDAARTWLAFVTNTIRAFDGTRPVISGMHSLAVETRWDNGDTKWRLTDQADYVDMVTTHPYAYFVPHCLEDRMLEMRTLLHATCESVFYSSVANRPCLTEEIGTLNKMICSDETSGSIIKLNLFSCWAHKTKGLLWWCGYDFNHIERAPYSWSAGEVELGIYDENMKLRPVGEAIKSFTRWIENSKLELPKPKIDGVCVLSKAQDHWGVGYMAYVLAKQAGANIEFAYTGNKIPEAPVYLLPSVKNNVIDVKTHKELLKRVENGATLYISNDFGLLFDVDKMLGISVTDSSFHNTNGEFEFAGEKIEYKQSRNCEVVLKGAECLAKDGEKIMMTVNKLGKGRVFFLNFPIEMNKADESGAFCGKDYRIYSEVFSECLKEHVILCEASEVGITEHHTENGCYAVMINYSGREVDPKLCVNERYVLKEKILGNVERIEPYGTAIALYQKK